MTLTEALAATGGGLGALAAALRGAEAVQKKRKKDAPDSGRAVLAIVETKVARIEAQVEANRQDIGRLLDREPPPDLSERVLRLEDDVRENATAAAKRHDKILVSLGELRGTLLAFVKGDSIHDR